MGIPRLPDAELLVMNIIWKGTRKVSEEETEEESGEMSSVQVAKILEGQKDWSATTILTFLSRLVERGFLTVRKEKRQNFYRAAVEESTYIESESKSFLERFHGNSITSLVAALCNDNAISKEDLAELRRFIDER